MPRCRHINNRRADECPTEIAYSRGGGFVVEYHRSCAEYQFSHKFSQELATQLDGQFTAAS